MKKILYFLLIISSVARSQVGANYRATVVDQTIATTNAMMRQTSTGNFETFTEVFINFDFKVGVTTSAPGNGATTFTHSRLINQAFDVYKNGVRLDTATNYTFDNSDGTITFLSALLTNDLISVRGKSKVYVYWPALEAPAAVYVDINFDNATNITVAGSIWTATASGTYAQTGLSNQTCPGDCRVITQYTNSNQLYAEFGLDATNAQQQFSTMDASYSIYSGGDVHKAAGGSGASTGTTISIGDYVGIYKNGSTVQLQKSTDKINWTNIGSAYALSGTGTLYIVTSIYDDGSLHGKIPFPQVINY